MYSSKYRHVISSVPHVYECSLCFGHPMFTSTESFALHQEECHQASSSYYPAGKQRKEDYLMGLTATKRCVSVDKSSTPVVGYRKSSSRISLANLNSCQLKDKEKKLREELKNLKEQQAENIPSYDCEQQNENLKTIITVNFDKVFNKIENLENKVQSSTSTTEKYNRVIQEKDQQIKSYKNANEALLILHAELKANLTNVEQGLKAEPVKASSVCDFTLKELSNQTKGLRSLNSSWKNSHNRAERSIDNANSEIEVYKNQLAEKEKELESKFSKQNRSFVKKLKELSSEKCVLVNKIEDLEKVVQLKEAECKRQQEWIAACDAEADEKEKLLIDGCIKELEEKYDIQNKIKKEKIARLLVKLEEVESLLRNSNSTLAKLENEKQQLETEHLDFVVEKESFEQTLADQYRIRESLEHQLEEIKVIHEENKKEAIKNLEHQSKLELDNGTKEQLINKMEKDLKEMQDKEWTLEEENVELVCIMEKLNEEIEKVTEARDEFEFKVDEKNEQIKLYKKSLDDYESFNSMQHRKMNSLIKENNMLYSKCNRHKDAAKEDQIKNCEFVFKLKQVEEELKQTNKVNQQVMKENEELKKQIKLLSESQNDDITSENLLPPTSTCQANVEVLTEVKSKVIGDEEDLPFNMDIDDLLDEIGPVEKYKPVEDRLKKCEKNEKQCLNESLKGVTVPDIESNDDYDYCELAEPVDCLVEDERNGQQSRHDDENEYLNESFDDETESVTVSDIESNDGYDYGELAEPVDCLEEDERDEQQSSHDEEFEYLNDSFEDDDDDEQENDDISSTLNSFHAISEVDGSMEEIMEECSLNDTVEEQGDGFEDEANLINHIEAGVERESKKHFLSDLPPLTKLPPLLTSGKNDDAIDDIDDILNELEQVKNVKRYF